MSVGNKSKTAEKYFVLQRNMGYNKNIKTANKKLRRGEKKRRRDA